MYKLVKLPLYNIKKTNVFLTPVLPLTTLGFLLLPRQPLI